MGTFKLNVDGACPRPHALPAIGMILGNSDGVVMAGQAFLVGVPRSASVVEALAIAYDFNIRDARQLLAAHPHISASEEGEHVGADHVGFDARVSTAYTELKPTFIPFFLFLIVILGAGSLLINSTVSSWFIMNRRRIVVLICFSVKIWEDDKEIKPCKYHFPSPPQRNCTPCSVLPVSIYTAPIGDVFDDMGVFPYVLGLTSFCSWLAGHLGISVVRSPFDCVTSPVALIETKKP
ncbi:hypothetical protein F3Y22_tig00111566pilonHSYRG00008 [Hibiscus syriacus]|uniref:Uncharacterized protein n=1 Tax=Hibiscus syriacus TaxID=106335 RepID=A0A6A2XKV1_HIBSY|nr:hypothetical protein F3Y22_tig00111566pilonHSYRG00008 [Hibiscus syriacus]